MTNLFGKRDFCVEVGFLALSHDALRIDPSPSMQEAKLLTSALASTSNPRASWFLFVFRDGRNVHTEGRGTANKFGILRRNHAPTNDIISNMQKMTRLRAIESVKNGRQELQDFERDRTTQMARRELLPVWLTNVAIPESSQQTYDVRHVCSRKSNCRKAQRSATYGDAPI